MLGLFPFSEAVRRRSGARESYALEFAEPPLIEQAFPDGEADPAQMVEAAREFAHEDCAVQVDASWDLWQFDRDWKLAPAAVTLLCLSLIRAALVRSGIRRSPAD